VLSYASKVVFWIAWRTDEAMFDRQILQVVAALLGRQNPSRIG
jgi:hypothetical protein